MRVIVLDHAGMAQMLKQPQIRAEITKMAERVADSARTDPAIMRHQAEIKVEHYTTDRAASAVLIKDAVGMGIEAKYSPLKRGAGFLGLKVKSKKK